MNRAKRRGRPRSSPVETRPAYAQAIIRAREKKKLTQADVAVAVNAGLATVAGWEMGKHGVGPQHRKGLSKLLGVPVMELVAA